MSPGTAFLEDVAFSFRRQMQLAEEAMGQLDSDADFFRKPGEHSNSVAIIVKHLAGNLNSRWTDFLTTDGDKPWRDRDAEFIVGPDDTRERLLAAWKAAWGVLFLTLAHLTEADLERTVTIRGEAHTVVQALHRSMTHAAYHTGQIVYLCRLLKKDGWRWITIPPGQSQQFKARGGDYLRRPAGPAGPVSAEGGR
jgi:uncharacterized damage-inducible protein DinB